MDHPERFRAIRTTEPMARALMCADTNGPNNRHRNGNTVFFHSSLVTHVNVYECVCVPIAHNHHSEMWVCFFAYCRQTHSSALCYSACDQRDNQTEANGSYRGPRERPLRYRYASCARVLFVRVSCAFRGVYRVCLSLLSPIYTVYLGTFRFVPVPVLL